MFKQLLHSNNNVISILQQNTLFQDFSKAELQELSNLIYVRWFKKEEIIFHENAPGMGMYIIHEGIVKFSRNFSLNGREQAINLNKGDFFGDLTLAEENPRSATAVAVDDCCLIGIFRPDLIRLLERKPRLGNRILLKLNQLISEKLQQRDNQLLQINEKLASLNFIR